MKKPTTCRMRRSSMWFKYAVRRNLTLSRNYILAEHYRRFWRSHPHNWWLSRSQIQNWTGFL